MSVLCSSIGKRGGGIAGEYSPYLFAVRELPQKAHHERLRFGTGKKVSRDRDLCELTVRELDSNTGNCY